MAPEVARLSEYGVMVAVRSLRDSADWPRPLSIARGALHTLVRFRELGFDGGGVTPRVRAKSWIGALQAAGLVRDLANEGFDAVHGYWASVPAAVAALLADAWRVPFSFTGHRWDIYARQFLAEKAEQASFIRAISARGADVLRQMLPGHGQLVKMVHVGIEIPNIVRRSPLPSMPRLLAVGGLVAVKGHLGLLSAVESLVKRGTPVTLDLVGSGPELQRLRTRVNASTTLSGRVRFLGQMSHAQTLSQMGLGYYAIVHSSIVGPDGLEEGVPVVLLEAAARYLPIVATLSGATSELVTDDTGWPCEANSSLALGRALERAISSPWEARERAKQAREVVRDEWNAENTARQMAELFAGSAGPESVL